MQTYRLLQALKLCPGQHLTTMRFDSRILQASPCHMVWNYFDGLYLETFRRGSGVWQTDRQADRQTDRMAFKWS